MKPSPPIHALTGLRFVAALMVFFSHFPIPGVTGYAANAMRSGYAGVTFFFVLSGFILTYTYAEKMREGVLSELPSYLLARIARVYPLYALCMIYAWLKGNGQIDLAPYLLAIQAWSSDPKVVFGLDAPGWSISVEFFLYLVFPFILPLARAALTNPKNIIYAIFGIVVTQFAIAFVFQHGKKWGLPILPAGPHYWLYINPLSRTLDLSLGMMGAMLYQHWRIASLTVQFSRVTLAVSIALLTAIMSSGAHIGTAYSWDASYAALFTLIILALALHRDGVASRFLSSPKMVLAGEASYAFYLLHWILLDVSRVQYDLTVEHSIAYEFFAIVVTMAAAVGAHVMIEKPCRVMIRNAGESLIKLIYSKASIHSA